MWLNGLLVELEDIPCLLDSVLVRLLEILVQDYVVVLAHRLHTRLETDRLRSRTIRVRCAVLQACD